MRTLCATLFLFLFVVVGNVAAQTTKVFGNWVVHVYHDRFTDKLNVTALTMKKQGSSTAIRCRDDNLSMTVHEANTQYREGDSFGIALRVDRQPVVETNAIAVNADILEMVDVSPKFISQVRDGRELAMRITGQVSTHELIFSLAGVAKALAPLIAVCPLDTKPKGSTEHSS